MREASSAAMRAATQPDSSRDGANTVAGSAGGGGGAGVGWEGSGGEHMKGGLPPHSTFFSPSLRPRTPPLSLSLPPHGSTPHPPVRAPTNPPRTVIVLIFAVAKRGRLERPQHLRPLVLGLGGGGLGHDRLRRQRLAQLPRQPLGAGDQQLVFGSIRLQGHAGHEGGERRRQRVGKKVRGFSARLHGHLQASRAARQNSRGTAATRLISLEQVRARFVSQRNGCPATGALHDT